MSENFTCNTCGLAFQEADFQRDHMKTEWHRYNLKRRVAGLPPIPSEVFADKLLTQGNEQPAPTKSKQVTKKELKRQEKERRRVANLSRTSSITSAASEFDLGEPTQEAYTSDLEELPEDEEEEAIQQKLRNRVEFKPNVCFMDGHESGSTQENVEYLEHKYGLILPEPRYISDLDGLVSYINEKVGLGNCCLYCTFMGRSLEAARAHMVSKQHCKIPYDTEAHKEELQDFYDFSASYADDGWEDDEDIEDGESGVVVHEDDLDQPLYSGGYELEVAPGKVAGHRDLMVYYKQRHAFKPKESEGRRAVKMIDLRSPGVTEKQAQKLVKQDWQQTKRAEVSKLKHDKHINFQKHFRDPLLQ